MPTYQVYINEDKLSKEQKQAVATAITEGHTKKTGAPKAFVQVVINEVPNGNRFVGGKCSEGMMWIRGDVRTRDAQHNAELLLEIVEQTAAVSPFDKNHIECFLCNIDSSNMMGFGRIIPPAGEEKDWFASLPDETKAMLTEMMGE